MSCPTCNDTGAAKCDLCDGTGELPTDDNPTQDCHACDGETTVACRCCAAWEADHD